MKTVMFFRINKNFFSRFISRKGSFGSQTTVKPRNLKVVLNMRINECVMRANFGDPEPRDRELRHKKT